MAQLADVNTALRQAVLTSMQDAAVITTVGTEWPPTDLLSAVAQGGNPVVAIHHRFTTYKSVGFRYTQAIIEHPTGIDSELSDSRLLPGQEVTVTLAFADDSTAVEIEDGVSFHLTHGDFDDAVVAEAEAGETLASLAVKLTNAINTTFGVLGLTATAVGAVVTVANTGVNGFKVESACGNTVTFEDVIKYAYRSMQITSWCRDLDTKFAIQQALESLLSNMDDDYGLRLPSDEVVRIKLNSAKPIDASTGKDVYCDTFMFMAEHSITKAEIAYETLVGIATVSQI